MTFEPQIALFADTFHEVNGAANVLRRLTAHASNTGRPFLCVCAGDETKLEKNGSVWKLQLRRSKLSFPINGDLRYDPFLWRKLKLVREVLNDFGPDVVHLTGVNDVSQIGYYLAHKLNLCSVASWHTNVHEYMTRRVAGILSIVPGSDALLRKSERLALKGIMKVHGIARLQLAPNEELVQMLKKGTNRHATLMSRGVDTEFLSPSKRTRTAGDDEVVLGFVGRLQPEKNVRFLKEIDAALRSQYATKYRWLIVGEGCETNWLRQNLTNVTLTGTLHGEELAEAYADMDLFVFPSRTDAFGNVVLEAMASGVPAVVMPDHGPKFLINNGVDGHIADGEMIFIETVVETVAGGPVDPSLRTAARAKALEYSWQSVFEQLYRNYQLASDMKAGTVTARPDYAVSRTSSNADASA